MKISLWLRTWRRSPLLTAQFAATIAIGMGAATALVSLMLALAYQPLPFRDSRQLVEIWETAQPNAHLEAISGPDVADFAGSTHNIFASFGGLNPPVSLWLTDRSGAAKITASHIQPSVLSDLAIRPVLGRGALPDDAPFGGSATSPAWISYQLWQTRYGGSPAVIGATIGLASSATRGDELPLQIVGVFPPRVNIPFAFGEHATDIWYLLERDLSTRPQRATIFFGLGRLRPGVSVAQAQAALSVVTERLARTYVFDRGHAPVVQSLEEIAHAPARQTMGLLALGVALVFLVACVNLAILMGAEGRRRRREVAIRAVFGAGRWRLWSEVAAEKCVLTSLSLGLGVAFAAALLRVLAQMVPAAGLGPALDQPPPLNLAVLLVFVAFALVAALIWSALLVAAADGQGSSRALASAGGMGYTGFSDSSPGAGRWRLVLLSGQAGIGICLLAAAALTARTYAKVSTANLGPAPSRTVLMTVCPSDQVNLTDAQLEKFHHQVLSQIERLPGTQAIARADLFPPPGSPETFLKQGDDPDAPRDATYPIAVSTGFFRTLGIPILFGRSFTEADNNSGEKVAVISMDMAEQNWTSPEQAVGSQFSFERKFDHPRRIIGVAANFTGYWSQKPVPTVYLPEVDSSQMCMRVILRTSDSPRTVAALAPQMLAGTLIPATISDVSTMQERWRATLTRPLARVAGILLLALLGLGLSVQGVYAVAAATVSARGHELAVRSALGAPPGRLAWNVTRELLIAVIAGSALGVASSLELQPILKHWLGPEAVWQVQPIAAAIVFLALAAAAGCYVPARAAARANPADVLRQG